MVTATDTKTFVYATYIRTTPEKIWEALTNGDFSEKYWFGFRVEMDLKAGGNIRIIPPKGQHSCGGDHPGKVLAYEPYRKLAYTWGHEDKPEVAEKRDGPSRVTFEIKPMGDMLRLTLIHENLLPEDVSKQADTFQGINNGWPAVLSSLKSLLESGKAIKYPLS